MQPVILVSNRLIKILGHIAKGLSYVFHFLFPDKRFTIPMQSNAIFKFKGTRKISPIIWQTNFTDKVTLPVYLNYLFNRLMAPQHEYRLMLDEVRADFIKSEFPDNIYANYKKLAVGASKADFWRILVLQKYGGIYMDIDAHLVWPAGFSVKPKDDELYIKHKRGEFTNYFIASKSKNPNLENIIRLIMQNIDKGSVDTSIYDLTGPKVLDKVLKKTRPKFRLYRYVCIQGSFTNVHFQYIDKAEGKWTEIKPEDLLVDDSDD